jgi:hypothetical protein
MGVVIALLANLAIAYYRFLLLTGRDLRFKSISDFWVSWVVSFAALYQGLYQISPPLFVYSHPAFVPGPVLKRVGIPNSDSPIATFFDL